VLFFLFSSADHSEQGAPHTFPSAGATLRFLFKKGATFFATATLIAPHYPFVVER
jgi:hypothetical protein